MLVKLYFNFTLGGKFYRLPPDKENTDYWGTEVRQGFLLSPIS